MSFGKIFGIVVKVVLAIILLKVIVFGVAACGLLAILAGAGA
jgi:hypothetical protein